MKLTSVFPQIKTDSNGPVKKAQATTDVESKSVSPAEGGDRVELTSGTKDAQRMKEVLSQTPDVRADRVETLKRQLENGEYKVDAGQVADRMLMSLITDHLTSG